MGGWLTSPHLITPSACRACPLSGVGTASCGASRRRSSSRTAEAITGARTPFFSVRNSSRFGAVAPDAAPSGGELAVGAQTSQTPPLGRAPPQPLLEGCAPRRPVSYTRVSPLTACKRRRARDHRHSVRCCAPSRYTAPKAAPHTASRWPAEKEAWTSGWDGPYGRGTGGFGGALTGWEVDARGAGRR
jgi:hypothetical protein